jgi:hypothetical protein
VNHQLLVWKTLLRPLHNHNEAVWPLDKIVSTRGLWKTALRSFPKSLKFYKEPQKKQRRWAFRANKKVQIK